MNYYIYIFLLIKCSTNKIDTNGASAATIRTAKHHGGVLCDTRWSGSSCEAGFQPTFRMPVDGSRGIAQLRILVPRNAYDKL